MDEIAILQGFDPEWFNVPGVSDWNRTSAAGDAVPPPLAAAVVEAVLSSDAVTMSSTVEICAGAGGLASASANLGLDHVGLFEQWEPATQILRTGKPWVADVVEQADVRNVKWSQYLREVGLLSGGPPCQPWSTAGNRRRTLDERDLLGDIHKMVAAIQPDAFIFENVPGLISESSMPYLREVLAGLRSPGPKGLKYGVVAGMFQAADFGVPQKRRRVFLIGLRNRPNAHAYRILDQIHAARTHRSPHMPDQDRSPWVTVGEALAGRPDPGGWRSWVHDEGEDFLDRSAAH